MDYVQCNKKRPSLQNDPSLSNLLYARKILIHQCHIDDFICIVNVYRQKNKGVVVVLEIIKDK